MFEGDAVGGGEQKGPFAGSGAVIRAGGSYVRTWTALSEMDPGRHPPA